MPRTRTWYFTTWRRFSYHGWKEYRPGVQKALFDNMASGTLSAGKDLKVTRAE